MQKADYQQQLDWVRQQLTSYGYQQLAHSRLALTTQYSNDDQAYVSYQGLTRAQRNNDALMIKWELVDSAIGGDSALVIELSNHQQILEAVRQSKESKHNQSLDAEELKSTEPKSTNSTLTQGNVTAFEGIVAIQASHIEGGIDLGDIDLNDKPWQFIAMVVPYLPQGSVKDYIKRHGLNQKQRYSLIISMAKSLNSLHESGWLHGDIKPSNFLLVNTEDEEPITTCLSDFAYAVAMNDNASAQVIDSERLLANEVLPRGTPAYLAPECWQGQSISVQSDIYAFGVTMYEVLTGFRPYNIDADSSAKLAEWAQVHCQKAIPLLPKGWQFLQPVMDRLLAKNYKNRYKSIQQVTEALSYYKEQ